MGFNGHKYQSDWEPDPKIWKLWKHCNRNHGGFLEIDIYEHCKNFGNNGDNFLVCIDTPGGQPSYLADCWAKYDTEDYNMGTCKEKGLIAFVVCGNAEIWDFINAFNSVCYNYYGGRGDMPWYKKIISKLYDWAFPRTYKVD